MDILDENLEKVLEKLLNQYRESVMKLTDAPLIISQRDCDKSEISALFEKGFFEGTCPDERSLIWHYSVRPTQKARYYFQNKEIFLQEQKCKERKENKRYWITTGIAIMSGLISLGALIVAIIALCK